MTDIVERLRALPVLSNIASRIIRHEAADEIERLRKEGAVSEDLERRVEALEAAVAKLTTPCTYEVRPYPFQQTSYNAGYDMPVGAYCTRHGWDCPNAPRTR